MAATTLTSAGADAQFADLLERHRGIVFKVAAAYSRNRADREDIAQEIVTQLHTTSRTRAWRRLDEIARFGRE